MPMPMRNCSAPRSFQRSGDGFRLDHAHHAANPSPTHGEDRAIEGRAQHQHRHHLDPPIGQPERARDQTAPREMMGERQQGADFEAATG
jgi:hypothetical protein